MPRGPGARRAGLRREDGGAHPGRPARAGRARPCRSCSTAPTARRERADRVRARPAGRRRARRSAGSLRRRTRRSTARLIAGRVATTRRARWSARSGCPQSRGMLREGPRSITFLLAGDVTLDAARGRPPTRSPASWLWRDGLATAHARQLAERAEARGLDARPRTASAAASPSGTRPRLRRAGPALHPARAARGRRARSRRPRAGELPPISCAARTSRAPCTATRTPPTAATRSSRWRARPTRSGCAYLTITDHSPNAHYANGLDLERLKPAVGRDRAGAGAGDRPAAARHRVRHPRATARSTARPRSSSSSTSSSPASTSATSMDRGRR